jgi:hypothetical protein
MGPPRLPSPSLPDGLSSRLLSGSLPVSPERNPEPSEPDEARRGEARRGEVRRGEAPRARAVKRLMQQRSSVQGHLCKAMHCLLSSEGTLRLDEAGLQTLQTLHTLHTLHSLHPLPQDHSPPRAAILRPSASLASGLLHLGTVATHRERKKTVQSGTKSESPPP